MPQFFDPDNLTAEQQQNWASAVATYSQLVRETARAAWLDLTPQDRAWLLEQGKARGQDGTQVLETYGGVDLHKPGNPNSALFARLLAGKAPLAYSPPLSYGFPWYEVVEEAGPFAVSIGGVRATSSLGVKGQRFNGAKEAILINQSPWGVLEMNGAAATLCEMLSRPGASRGPHDAALLGAIKAVFLGGPEMQVNYGPWGPYALRMGAQKSIARRDHVLKTIAGGFAGKMDSLWDPHDFALNGRIGETLSTGPSPAERLAKMRAEAAMRPAGWARGGDTLTTGIRLLEETLEEETRKYEADPAARDYVEFFWDGWTLAKD